MVDTEELGDEIPELRQRRRRIDGGAHVRAALESLRVVGGERAELVDHPAVVPLPAALLDVLIAANIAMSLLVLLVAMQVRKPLEFAVFPTLVLVGTILRLAGPSPDATSRVKLGGREVAPSGSWSARLPLAGVYHRAGALSLAVPSSSAALVTLVPAHSAAR